MTTAKGRLGKAVRSGAVLVAWLLAGAGTPAAGDEMAAGRAPDVAADGAKPVMSYLYRWGEPGTGTGQFRAIRGIVAHDRKASDRIVVVVADTGRDLVRAFTSDMMFIDKWGESGSGAGEFSEPRGVAIDGEGKLLVVDAGNHRIQKTEVGTATFLERPGESLSAFGRRGSADGEFEMPTGVAVTADGEILVVDTGNHRVQRFDASGQFLSSFGTEGDGDGEFRHPTYVAIDSAGHLYVSDTGNHRLQRFDAEGVYLGQIGKVGREPGHFAEPKGLAVDGEGNLWVVDRRNHRVQKFDPQGRFVGAVGQQGGGNGDFNFPEDLAIDSRGRIYVTDGMNSRIQVFKPN
ncbi:MAG: 6-bladed beta-propeller [Acidobacteriota bacterium]